MIVEGAHRGHPSEVLYKGQLTKNKAKARSTIETLGEKDETEIRKNTCKNFLKDLGEITPEMLIEISARREDGYVRFEDGTEVKLHENSDMYFIHGDLKAAAKNGLPGVIKRYALVNQMTKEQLIMDVYSPNEKFSREWTIESIQQFLAGTFKNESFLVA